MLLGNKNRRNYHRFKAYNECICFVNGNNEELLCSIHDVSEKGVCFEFANRVDGILKVGDMVAFQFIGDTLPQKEAVIEAKGTIANIRKSGDRIMVGCTVPTQKDFKEFAHILRMKNFKEYLESQEKK